MKAIKPVMLVLAASLTASVAASEYEFVAADNTIGTQLCMSAVNNDIKKIKKLAHKLERNTPFISQKLKVVARNQNCNDVNIVRFAQTYGAEKTTRYMSKYLYRNVTVRQDLAKIAKLKSDGKKKVIVISGN